MKLLQKRSEVMASLVMHLLIADQLGNSVKTEDNKELLLLGSIAPDGSKSKQSHFKENGPYFEYGRFIKKYWDYRSHPFFIGYLSHLIADDIWQIYRQYSGLRQKMKNDSKVNEAYYNDFRLLNAKLLKEYNKEDLRLNLTNAIDYLDLEEVRKEDVMEIKLIALSHFNYSKEDEEAELQVLSHPDVNEYIGRTVNRVKDIIGTWAV
jgi:hypothetical protein